MVFSFAIFACIFCWAAIVAGPVIVAFVLNRKQKQRNFENCIRQINGTIIRRENGDGSVAVRIPYEEFEISGAYFSSSNHWFGKEVLELHFALPPSEAQVYFCCNCSLGRQLPPGWNQIQTKIRSNRIAAATAHPDSQQTINIGLENTFEELLRSKLNHRCRAAIDHNTLILLIGNFGGTANMGPELAKVLAIGAQMSRQIWMVLDGSINVSEAQATAEEDQTCPICSCGVEHPVYCERCKTPHCRDCWTYNGDTCGVFACGGRATARKT